MDDYRIRLTPKSKGIEYRDPEGVYRFVIDRNGDTWSLFLPAAKGDDYQPHDLSPIEEARIIPRVTQYLENLKWFVFFGGPYRVTIVRLDAAN
jgi:hypothetical protein